MKKIALTCFAALAVFALAACEITSEETYDYAGFKAMLAEKEFKLEYKKAHAKINEDGKKSELDYEYDGVSKRFVADYEEVDEETGETFRGKSYEAFDVVSVVESYSAMAEYLKIKIDDSMKFYVTNGEYRVVADFTSEGQKQEGEQKFNKEGYLIYRHSVVKDKDGKVVMEETAEYSYSK